MIEACEQWWTYVHTYCLVQLFRHYALSCKELDLTTFRPTWFPHTTTYRYTAHIYVEPWCVLRCVHQGLVRFPTSGNSCDANFRITDDFTS